jgi:hypothetical protein
MRFALLPAFAALLALTSPFQASAQEAPTDKENFKRGGPLEIEGFGGFSNNRTQEFQAANTSKQFLLISSVRTLQGGACQFVPSKYLIGPKEKFTFQLKCTQPPLAGTQETPEEIQERVDFLSWIKYDTFATKEDALKSLTRDKKVFEFWTGGRDRYRPLMRPSVEFARRHFQDPSVFSRGYTLPLGMEAIHEEYKNLDDAGKDALIQELGNFPADKIVPTEWENYFKYHLVPEEKTQEELGVRITLAEKSTPLTSLVWEASEQDPKKIKFEVLPESPLALAGIALRSNYKLEVTADLNQNPTEITISPEKGVRETLVKTSLQFVLATPKEIEEVKKEGKNQIATTNVLYLPISLERTPVLKVLNAQTSQPVESLLWDTSDMTKKTLRVELLPEHNTELDKVEVVGIHNDNLQISTKKIDNRTHEVVISRKKGTKPWAMATARFSLTLGENQINERVPLIVKNTKKTPNSKAEEKETPKED